MSSKSVRVHDKVFPTKTAATHAIRSILYRYEIGQALNDADSFFMLGVLLLHPQAQRKIGCGVASFSVERQESSRCFWVTRRDGTRTDFSYVACLTPPSPEKEAKVALRREVREQILDFRAACFSSGPQTCPITGSVLTDDATTHVDHHDSTFDALIARFLSEQGLILASIAVNDVADGDTATTIVDRNLASRWSAFHREHARLRLVSRRANLSVLRRSK